MCLVGEALPSVTLLHLGIARTSSVLFSTSVTFALGFLTFVAASLARKSKRVHSPLAMRN